MRIKKQHSSIAWLVIAVLCCMLHTVSADTFGLFTYTDNGTSITITGYPSEESGAVNIPPTIVGKPVTQIGPYAFSDCIRLTSITLPASVTSIGVCAFSRCSGLTTITVDSLNAKYSSLGGVLFDKNQTALIQCPGSKTDAFTIPASVTSIGDYAFVECTGLTSITIPASVTSIGTYAFDWCLGLTSITIPASVTSIGDYAFSMCVGLTSITIPASVTSIGDYVFMYCTGLTNVTISASVTSIGVNAFFGCMELTSITVDSLNAKYSSLGGVLFDKNQTLLIQCPSGKTGAVTIPTSVTSIGDYAFFFCTGLTSITIPVSVTSIGSGAFESCGGLTSIALPAGVTSIGDYAFYSCTGLTSVTISYSATSLGNEAFFLCTNLTSAFFTGHAPSMGGSVFDSAATGFTVYYFNDKSGFTSPTWQGYAAVNMGNSTPAATWLLSNNLPYNADLQTDPNGDGVSLLMAYALNLDPKQNLGGSMPKPVMAGNQMSLTFYAGSAGVSYLVQSSTDLQTWSATGVSLSAPDANNFRTATVNQNGPKKFLRIVAGY